MMRQRPTTSFRLLSALLVAVLAPWGAQAQEDETAAGNSFVPAGIQRTRPPTRVPQSSAIERGSPGLLEDEARQDLGSAERGETSASSGLEILPEACESELALSAAPEHLRDGAGVYVLRKKGFHRARESSNGFVCIVNRDHPRALKPTCFDAEGVRTILPKIIDIGGWLLEGLEGTEILQRIEHGFVTGRYAAPARPGVAYMLSNYNRPWYSRSQSLGRFPPHVMFYAPDLTPEDIGFDPEAFSQDRSLPLLGYPGPHGYMMMITGAIRDRDRGELRRCPSWIWK